VTVGDGPGAVADLEAGERDEISSSPELPEALRNLDEQERALGISLRRLFAEQEHGLRQKYAEWILWLLAVVTRHLFPNRDGDEARAA
jgi:hypothetical protein